MKGQLFFRQTNQKSNTGKDVYIAIGLVTLEDENIKDGYKYDLYSADVFNGVDYTELSDNLSPEDLLEEKIWKIK